MASSAYTRDELLRLIDHTFAEWQTALDQVPPDLLETPFMGDWSVRDVVYHLTWFEREMIPIARERVFGGSPWWDLPVEESNRLIFEEGRRLPPAEVLAEHRRVHAELLAELAKLEDADLTDPARIKDLPPDWMLWTVLEGNTFGHYPDHAEPLRRWLAGQTG